MVKVRNLGTKTMANFTAFRIKPFKDSLVMERDKWRELAHCVTDKADQIDYDKIYSQIPDGAPIPEVQSSDSEETVTPKLKEGVLSFRNILKLINDQGEGDTVQARLESLRKDIIKAYKAEPKITPVRDKDGRALLLDENKKAVVCIEGKFYYVNDDDDDYPATNREYTGDNGNLRTWAAEKEPDIEAEKKLVSIVAKRLYNNRWTRGIGDEENAQANVLMLLDEAALDFFENLQGDPNFDEIWSSFVANNFAGFKERLSQSERFDLMAQRGIKHSYALDSENKHIKCTYDNVGGENGLSVTIVDNRLTILTKGSTPDQLKQITTAQYNDLLDILKSRGSQIEVDDKTAALLKSLNVVLDNGTAVEAFPDKPNKEDNETHTSLYDHLVKDGLVDDDSLWAKVNGYRHDDVEHPEQDGQGSYSSSASASASGSSGSGAGLDDDGAEHNSFQFLSDKGKTLESKEIRKKFFKEFNKEHIDHTIDVIPCFGGFEIACWGSDEDKYNDGKIDTKTGIKKDTRMFGCKIKYGPPPSATLTSGNLKKLTKTDAAAIFKAMKAAGALYVQIPGKNEVGSEAYKNMLEATISGGLVPVMGNGPYASKGIGQGELGKIYKALKESDRKWEEQIEYSLRIAEQIKVHKKECPKDDVGSYDTFFLAHARFGFFKYKYFDNLKDYVGVTTKKAVKGEDGKWHLTDEVVNLNKNTICIEDVMCAKKAMTNIIENLSKGKLPKIDENGEIVRNADGKIQYEAFDPTDKNGENMGKLQKVMSAYMVAEKVNVLNRLEEECRNARETGDYSKEYKAIQNIDREITQDYDLILSRMKGDYMVDISGAGEFKVSPSSENSIFKQQKRKEKTANGQQGRNSGGNTNS